MFKDEELYVWFLPSAPNELSFLRLIILGCVTTKVILEHMAQNSFAHIGIVQFAGTETPAGRSDTPHRNLSSFGLLIEE